MKFTPRKATQYKALKQPMPREKVGEHGVENRCTQS